MNCLNITEITNIISFNLKAQQFTGERETATEEAAGKNSAGNSPSAAASARNQLSPFGHQQRVHLPRRPRAGPFLFCLNDQSKTIELIINGLFTNIFLV